MSIFMLSLAGLPPLAGFFGKFYLFSAALRAGANHGLLWLVALALFGSLISLDYYLIILKAIFVDQPGAKGEFNQANSVINVDFLQRASLSVLAAFVILLGIAPTPLVSRILASLP